MKKEIIEFENMENELFEIAESPCFNDEMRNKASDLYQYINQYKVEPLKVGDWVKFENDKGVYIFQIAEVNSDWVKPTKVISDLYAFPHDGHYIDYCTKLTPEQVKILGLEVK